MIVIDLSKQQALDANPKPMQEINFTGNLYRAENRTTFFIIFSFHKGLWEYCDFILFKHSINVKTTQQSNLNVKLILNLIN